MRRADRPSAFSRDSLDSPVLAGIHLAGSNARKSAVVLLEITDDSVSFLSLYEKIGSSGSLFSDERILSILGANGEISDVVVDCPMTDPPCVSCTRPVCPGVVRCDDVSVAMMMAIEQSRGRKGAHKLRPLNPQNQRLWDVMYARGGPWGNLEPSYSANLAPLVVRARTLQRRLAAVYPKLRLRETNIPILLMQLATVLDAPDWSGLYRNFERGSAIRREILSALASERAGELRIDISQDALQSVSSSVENFHAYLAAAMGVWRRLGLAVSPSPFFEASPGWVEMLEIDHPSKAGKPSRSNRLS